MATNHNEKKAVVALFGLLTFSDTRTSENDVGGQTLRRLVEEQGHTVAHASIVREDPPVIQQALKELLDNDSVELIVTTGGTGISLRDCAYEAVSELLVKRLDGFGELFRMLSFEQVGAASMLSRAVGGLTHQGKFIFALPGSPKAVELAMTRLILPQVAHLLHEARKER